MSVIINFCVDGPLSIPLNIPLMLENVLGYLTFGPLCTSNGTNVLPNSRTSATLIFIITGGREREVFEDGVSVNFALFIPSLTKIGQLVSTSMFEFETLNRHWQLANPWKP
jgi:hypothetical protein